MNTGETVKFKHLQHINIEDIHLFTVSHMTVAGIASRYDLEGPRV